MRATVEDRHFQIVDLDARIINAARVEGAQQVLGGRQQDAFAHQAGRVADSGDMPPISGNLERVKIRPHENDATARRRRENSQRDVLSAVETDTSRLNLFDGAGFKLHGRQRVEKVSGEPFWMSFAQGSRKAQVVVLAMDVGRAEDRLFPYCKRRSNP